MPCGILTKGISVLRGTVSWRRMTAHHLSTCSPIAVMRMCFSKRLERHRLFRVVKALRFRTTNGPVASQRGRTVSSIRYRIDRKFRLRLRVSFARDRATFEFFR